MLLADVAAATGRVRSRAARSAKVQVIAECLREADPDEVEVVVAYLTGELPQRRTGVGWAALRSVPAPASGPTLTVADADAAVSELATMTGKGSQAARGAAVSELFGRATEPEQRLLRGLFSGELRQGAQEGAVLDAVARAAGAPVADVRRAVMLRGSIGPVAAALLAGGLDRLGDFRLEVGRPVQPMLAATAPDVATAIGRLGRAAVEWKLDGVRVQVHRDGSLARVFTRSLDEITDRVPEVAETVLGLPARQVVLDAEAIALRPDGRPHPFQLTGARMGSRVDVAAARATAPLTTYVFDVLHLDGRDLLGDAAEVRDDVLRRLVPERNRAPRITTDDVREAEAFFRDALLRGHEGVVVKSLDLPYEAGRRGSGWLKVKPRHTLDLVVLAAEWGHGRRRGWLSNLHLGARDPRTGELVMLGKTFKGMTDETLRWQTERFQALEIHDDGWVVTVRPEQVVEIAFDGVQRSTRYPGGVALRFARVLRYRDDKAVDEADTIDTVRSYLAGTRTEAGP